MADSYVGEIRMFGGNFAPLGWMLCEGQLLPINQNQALFALIGTTYGGDGVTTFALPDLRGRLPLHFGQGPGLSSYVIGEVFGTETVTLTSSSMPFHTHQLEASTAAGTSPSPTGLVPAVAPDPIYTDTSLATASLAASAFQAPAGGGQPHNNFMPYLCVNFIISLFGVFPSQN